MMNKNFKKVLDLISEMKENFTKSSQKFETAELLDGTVVEFEALEVGQAVFVVTETETIPAPQGTHSLAGDFEGVSIIVDEAGIITEIIDERVTDEVVEEEAAVEEQLSSDQVFAMIDSKVETFGQALEDLAKMVQSFAQDNANLESEIAKLKAEFNSFKESPVKEANESQKFAKIGALTARQEWIKKNNKL